MDCFGVSMDVLFGKSVPASDVHLTASDVPWADDDNARVAVYIGKQLVNDPNKCSDFSFTLDGETRNVECEGNISQ